MDACGPDVSAPLRSALSNIESTFTSTWTLWQRCLACRNIVTFPQALAAWDINPLMRLGYSGITGLTWDRIGIGGIRGSGDLDRTVALDGKCYHASNVNYAMWGTINKLCYGYFGGSAWSLSSAKANVAFYRTVFWWGSGIDEAHAFTDYGYNGTDPSAQAITGCYVDPGNKSDQPSFGSRWDNSFHPLLP
jgi:hypothetical protein